MEAFFEIYFLSISSEVGIGSDLVKMGEGNQTLKIGERLYVAQAYQARATYGLKEK